jgi:hypothetical protein
MKVRYVVQCQRHGQESKDWAGKQIVTSPPKGKKDRNTAGCPMCKKEAMADAAEKAEQS